jgi:hypothetical protein
VCDVRAYKTKTKVKTRMRQPKKPPLTPIKKVFFLKQEKIVLMGARVRFFHPPFERGTPFTRLRPPHHLPESITRRLVPASYLEHIRDAHNNNKHAYAGTSDCFTHLRALLVLH